MEADKQFDLVFAVLRAGRSLAASYSLQSNIQCKLFPLLASSLLIRLCIVFLHARTEEEAILFESQVPTIVTLTKGCTSAKVVRDAKTIPAGCGSTLVTSTIVVHTLVRVCLLMNNLSFLDSNTELTWYCRVTSTLMLRFPNVKRNLTSFR